MGDTVYAIDPYKMKTGDKALGLVYMKTMNIRPKSTGGVYGDAEGYYKGRVYPIKIWDADLIDKLRNVTIFLGNIRVDSYKGALQVAIERVVLTNPDGVDETFFFDAIEPSVLNEVKVGVLNRIGKYKDLFEQLVKPFDAAFYNTPAAKLHHDNCIGGLAYHTFKTAKIAISLADMYGLNAEFIGFCALVHDIGKVIALSPKTIDYTQAGMVQGHSSLGIRILSVNKTLLDKYLTPMEQHIVYGVIENHHGRNYGGNPTTIEAFIVHYADLTEANLAGYCDYTKKQIELGEVGTSTWFSGGYYFVGGHEFK